MARVKTLSACAVVALALAVAPAAYAGGKKPIKCVPTPTYVCGT